MIKAIIFDLNGILIQSPKLSSRFAEHFGIPETEFVGALKNIMPIIRLPNAGDAFRYWQPYIEKWGTAMTRKQFFEFWFNAEKENHEIIELARTLRQKGLRLFVLSNNFIERAEYYEKNFSFLKELFDQVYYSWQTGFIKPDPRAYQILLSENNLKAEECIYFDDSKENVEAASQLGLKAYYFDTTKNLRQILSQFEINK